MNRSDVRKGVLMVMILSFVLALVYALSLSGSEIPPNPAGGVKTKNRKSNKNIALKPSTKFAASTLPGLDGSSDIKTISSQLFPELINTAKSHPRKRKMHDLTKEPTTNTMQTLVNTWTEGSLSPVHKHSDYSEAFVILDGALAFFTFTDKGDATCHVISSSGSAATDRVIIVEKNQWHAMTAAPVSLGYPGHAVIFETSGHLYDTTKATKILASFAPVYGDGMDGDPEYFQEKMKLCPHAT